VQRLSFAMSRKGSSMSEQVVHDWIRKAIANNDVVLFMKGTKTFPQCGFSSQVAQILGHMGVDYKDVNVLEDMGIREGIKSFSDWPTIPQLYVKGEFVGGCDIIREMFQQGELLQLFDDKGVNYDRAKMTA
jgi:monothiol glutaredoxin